MAEFVADCDWHYVLNCLDRGISSTRFSGNALHAFAKNCIVQRRRQQKTGRHDWELDELSKGEARELWHDIEALRSVKSPRECRHHDKLLAALLGMNGITQSSTTRSRKTTNSRTCAALLERYSQLFTTTS